ncbi:MAG: hypothetical protein HW374_1349 [Bacteroidetes bacterium]|nr:hypothetical protein [Bacteroidota bacterium]
MASSFLRLRNFYPLFLFVEFGALEGFVRRASALGFHTSSKSTVSANWQCDQGGAGSPGTHRRNIRGHDISFSVRDGVEELVNSWRHFNRVSKTSRDY